jgi:hypothetical protein
MKIKFSLFLKDGKKIFLKDGKKSSLRMENLNEGCKLNVHSS